MYVYAQGATTTSSRKVYVKNVVFSGTTAPGGPPPSVQTTAAIATGRTTASISGDVLGGGLAVGVSDGRVGGEFPDGERVDGVAGGVFSGQAGLVSCGVGIGESDGVGCRSWRVS